MAQTAVLSYQGSLNVSGSTASGTYDFAFTLTDAATNGNYLGTTFTNASVAVTNGLFTVPLSFDGSLFDGSARWLEIGVRTNGSTDPYTVLVPRQPVLSVPYAVYASSAGTAAGVAGTLTNNLAGDAAFATNAATFDGLGTNAFLTSNGSVEGTNIAATSGFYFTTAVLNFYGSSSNAANSQYLFAGNSLPAAFAQCFDSSNGLTAWYTNGAGWVMVSNNAGIFGVIYDASATAYSPIVWVCDASNDLAGGDCLFETGWVSTNHDPTAVLTWSAINCLECAGPTVVAYGQQTNAALILNGNGMPSNFPTFVVNGSSQMGEISASNVSATALSAGSLSVGTVLAGSISGMPSLNVPTFAAGQVTAPFALFNQLPGWTQPAPSTLGLQQTPVIGFADFNQGVSEAEVINIMNFALSNHWTNYNIGRWIDIDDSWQNATRNADGNLYWNTNNFPDGIPFLCATGHALGFHIMLYTQMSALTDAGRPGSADYYEPASGCWIAGTNFWHDISNYVAWGVDGIRLDGFAGEGVTFETGVYHAQTNLIYLTNLWSTFEGGVPFVYSSSSWSDCTAPAQVNAFMYDNTGTDYPGWEQLVQNFYFYVSMYQNCTGPAHFPAFPINADSYTLTNGQLALAAMTCSSVLFVDTAYTASRTNADLLAIWNDPLFIPCYEVNSNAAGSVWCRPLTNNDLAVMLLNPTTDGPVTIGFSGQDLGFQPGVNLYARDIFAGTNFVFSGSYTNIVAGTNMILLRVSQAGDTLTGVTNYNYSEPKMLSWSALQTCATNGLVPTTTNGSYALMLPPGATSSLNTANGLNVSGGAITNNGMVWLTLPTDGPPAGTNYPSGSFCTTATGELWIMSGGTWVLH